jgi:predicted RNase H-like nuclease (RuvC/YqgF family)
MNQSTIERALMLVGSLLLVLFALSFALPGLANYKNEIKLLVLLGVILYAAYSFWTQSKDAKDLHAKANEAAKWRSESAEKGQKIEALEGRIQNLEASLREAELEAQKNQQLMEQSSQALEDCQKAKA